MQKKFSKEAAVKVDARKDFIDISSVFGNTAALIIVKAIYKTFLTPIHISFIVLVTGLAGALFIYNGDWLNLVIGAMLIQLKNIFDAVDGSLARARNTPSRIGRFLDSVVDFVVGLVTFLAIGFNLSGETTFTYLWPLIIAAFISSMIQCSYYVYYNVQYLTRVKQKVNISRVEETFTENDKSVYSEHYKQQILILLQSLFLVFYGWQDKFIKVIDSISLKFLESFSNIKLSDKTLFEWYNKKKLLMMNSFLGLGTQLFLLSLMAVLNQLYLYLWIVILVGNFYLLCLIICRLIISRNIKS